MAGSENALHSRLESEREFHDKRYQDGESRTAQLKYYWAIDEGAQVFGERVSKLAVGADILEYGCGLYSQAGALGPICKSFQAIDISDAAVQRMSETYKAPNVSFTVMDAMKLTFPDDSFDLIYGSGIVHHLDVESCAREVSRVLRPGGSAVFWEPLGYNPLINVYRWLTPNARTPDEHPLVAGDFKTLARAFQSVDIRLFGLTSIAAVPLRKTPAGTAVRNLLARLDDLVLRVPGVRNLAWYSVIHCKN